MPIYEYQCTGCGEITEALQKFSDPPLTHCEKCHGQLKKLISHSSFHLKGSGWYVTDYAGKKSGSGTDSKDKSGAADSSDKAGRKTSSKTSDET